MKIDQKREQLAPCIDAEFSDFLKYMMYENNEPILWLFGYGSLIWLPNFEYAKSEMGFVEGFAIRFWQGNTTHRGTPESPGRVPTLIEDRKPATWGRSFQLRGRKQINEALKHLCTREMKLGGYKYECMDFHVRGSKDNEIIQAVTFIATPDNDLYLGPASIDEIAETIVHSEGKSGSNLEYLFRLIDSLREFLPGIIDEHLWNLEDACHILLHVKQIEYSYEELDNRNLKNKFLFKYMLSKSAKHNFFLLVD
ncbi:glutathione-specific gamma-glutamylcyclotransferase 1-like [Styela clava]|uniref:glutathione-specific gamma-glutamylcyclotransferase 1-like n=1 Tax=Styela clava TaxID=7725 RepID=UPI00193A5CA3|nr:glutathione-specific gamma-glutamylcyclotransferase 1-like [Styela clava]